MRSTGSQNNRGGWRSGPEDGPPDLVQLFKKFFLRFNYLHASLGAVGLSSLIILSIWLISGFFLVSAAEQSVVLRFGKYIETLSPGPHWIPVLFESRYTINTQRIESFPYESEMLTKDENIVSVKVQVQYRITNLKDYLFNIVTPVLTLQQAISSTLRQVVGQMNLDPILTTGREELTQRVEEQLRKTLQIYKSGLDVREVTLQSVRPPEAVTAAFDDVVKAREDKQRYINQAEAYAKKKVLIAEGQIARIEQEANAFRYSVVAEATGATARYLALLKPYQQAPIVTRERLYLDTMTQVLNNTNNIFVEGTGNNNMLYLPQLFEKQNILGRSATVAANPNSDLKLMGESLENMNENNEGAAQKISNTLERPSYSMGENSQ